MTKIYIKRFKDEEGNTSVDFPKVMKKGDWIDLRASKDIVLNAPQAGTLKGKEVKHRDVISDVTYIPLGIGMKLPEGYEAIVVPRSNIAKSLGIMMANSQGVIDFTYCGNEDQWHFPAITLRKTRVPKNTRICQFRIQLSQKATTWQKIKWIFSSGIKLVEVDSLDNINRGGLGSTGLK